MAKRAKEADEGHILGRLGIAQHLANFMGLQFKVYGAVHKAKKLLADALGMPDKQELEKLSEELERATGKLNRERGQ